jgi:hypothetical protein
MVFRTGDITNYRKLVCLMYENVKIPLKQPCMVCELLSTYLNVYKCIAIYYVNKHFVMHIQTVS